jgi:hypothetical protein
MLLLFRVELPLDSWKRRGVACWQKVGMGYESQRTLSRGWVWNSAVDGADVQYASIDTTGPEVADREGDVQYPGCFVGTSPLPFFLSTSLSFTA